VRLVSRRIETLVVIRLRYTPTSLYVIPTVLSRFLFLSVSVSVSLSLSLCYCLLSSHVASRVSTSVDGDLPTSCLFLSLTLSLSIR